MLAKTFAKDQRNSSCIHPHRITRQCKSEIDINALETQIVKLIGSKTEQDFREELLRSHEILFSKGTSYKIKSILNNAGFNTDNAFALSWHSDQTEEFYTVLIDGEDLVHATIDIDSGDVVGALDCYKADLSKKGESRMQQVKLLVAMDLANT